MKTVSYIKNGLLILILLLIWAVSSVRAEDNKTVILREWTTQIIYDTTNACYEGTIKWIVMTNPSLLGQMPSYATQRQMITHCFCVMDSIRKEFKINEYQKLVYDPQWTGNLFMTKALLCVKEEKTLPSFFTSQTQTVEEDNKTIITPEGKPEDSQELLPNQQEEELEGLPETIFQG